MKLTNMTATIIPPRVLEAKRQKREKQRQQREAMKGSILAPLDDEGTPPCAPASRAREKETHR